MFEYRDHGDEHRPPRPIVRAETRLPIGIGKVVTIPHGPAMERLDDATIRDGINALSDLYAACYGPRGYGEQTEPVFAAVRERRSIGAILANRIYRGHFNPNLPATYQAGATESETC
jgi:hypothetical protein